MGACDFYLGQVCVMDSKNIIAITQAREERDYLLAPGPYVPRDGPQTFRERLAGNLTAVVTGPKLLSLTAPSCPVPLANEGVPGPYVLISTLDSLRYSTLR